MMNRKGREGKRKVVQGHRGEDEGRKCRWSKEKSVFIECDSRR